MFRFGGNWPVAPWDQGENRARGVVHGATAEVAERREIVTVDYSFEKSMIGFV